MKDTAMRRMAGVIFYQAIAVPYPNMSVAPDWLLGFLFGIGRMYGMCLGARFRKFVPAEAIKWILAGVFAFTTAKQVAGFFGL